LRLLAACSCWLVAKGCVLQLRATSCCYYRNEPGRDG